MRLLASDNSTEATEESREVMRTQYEWLFMHMTVTSHNATEPEGQDIIVYSVSSTKEVGGAMSWTFSVENSLI